MRRKAIVPLIRKLIAIGNGLTLLRIDAGKIQQYGAGDAKAIGSDDGDRIAKTVAKGVKQAAAALRPQMILLGFARPAVAHGVMKVRQGLDVHRTAEVEILILLGCAVGDVV